jgi:hypothetical protein
VFGQTEPLKSRTKPGRGLFVAETAALERGEVFGNEDDASERLGNDVCVKDDVSA